VALVVVVLFLRGGLVEVFLRLRDTIGRRGAQPESGEDVRVPVRAERETGS
jgi:hypothetical protein